MTSVRGTFRISGRVQGVCFRMCTREEAERLGLTGWVRNLPNGGVEVVAEGPRERVRRLLAWCREGPPLARVAAVNETVGEATGEFRDFSIRP